MLLKTRKETARIEDEITDSLFLDLYDLLSTINRQIGLTWIRELDKELYSQKMVSMLDKLEYALEKGAIQ